MVLPALPLFIGSLATHTNTGEAHVGGGAGGITDTLSHTTSGVLHHIITTTYAGVLREGKKGEEDVDSRGIGL